MIDDELIDLFKMISIREESNLKELSNIIDNIIKYKVEDERTISEVFDSLLSLEFIEEDKKRKVFHKLSIYCRKFDKSLADEYDEILEEHLRDDFEDEIE